MSNTRLYQISDEAKNIYELAKAGKISALKQIIPTCNREAKNDAVKLLAKEHNMAAIQQLSGLFLVEQDDVIVGLAMGGHTQAIRDYHDLPQSWPMYEFQGYALGRQIEKVNNMISDHDNDVMIGTAGIYYEIGGHTQNLDDTLELITLTTSRGLREVLISLLKKTIPSVDGELLLVKAEKLSLLMQQHKIDYQRALAILTDVAAQEAAPKTIKSKSALYSDSIRLFRQAASAKLSFYQKKAVDQLGRLGITEYIMLNWKPHECEHDFSYNHLQALRFLLEEQKLEPVEAIKEISQLSVLQINALIELYSSGLRGGHLREWQQRENNLIFSDENLESLLRLTQ